MRFECVEYWPTNPRVSPLDVKKEVPVILSQHLLVGGSFSYGIFVDMPSGDVENAFDELFKINSSCDYIKRRRIEVSGSDIDGFDFFRLSPEVVEPFGGYVIVDNPTDEDSLVSAMREVRRSCAPPAIFEIGANTPGIVLAISDSLYTAFDENAVTGLHLKGIVPGKGGNDGCAFRLATLEEGGYCEADAIVAGAGDDLAAGRVLAPHLVNQRFPRQGLRPLDFQRIDRVVVKGQSFLYIKPRWIVSRRIVKIMLQMKVKGLKRITLKLNEKYIPVPVG